MLHQQGAYAPRSPGNPRFDVISPELLAILRCPMDPSHTPLELDQDRLVCSRCRVVFPTREGFAALLIEEAKLPEGCSSIEQLPCQREKK